MPHCSFVFSSSLAANPPGIAYDAVYAAYYLTGGAQIDESVLGGEYQHTLYADILLITPDNFWDWFDKIQYTGEGTIVDDFMAPDVILEKWFVE